MLKKSRNILSSANETIKSRARVMFKDHRKGKGEFFLLGNSALLRWPASNQHGEGDGYWTTVISGRLATCACPAFQNAYRNKPCKHIVLTAGLIVYHLQREEHVLEQELMKTMMVCTG